MQVCKVEQNNKEQTLMLTSVKSVHKERVSWEIGGHWIITSEGLVFPLPDNIA
jgi:hypothetical protein